MQAAPIRTPANARHPGPGWRLPVIVVGVALAHMALLLAAPDVLASHAATALGVIGGCRIVRVHDVRETVDALKIWNSVNEG